MTPLPAPPWFPSHSEEGKTGGQKDGWRRERREANENKHIFCFQFPLINDVNIF